jgi:Bacterial SH3 domain
MRIRHLPRLSRISWLQLAAALAFAFFAVISLSLAGFEQAIALEQAGTPLPIIIPTRTATILRQTTVTPSRTPTSAVLNQGRVEAKDKSVGANIRAAPDVGSEKLGNILPGQFYAIVQRYNKWIQIQYEKSPNGLGWVYEDIVNITGVDPAAIPTAQPGGIPSPNVATAAAQQTSDYLTATPGAPQTATALQGSATGIFTRVAGNAGLEPTRSEPLPTFTFPPAMLEATLPPRASAAASQSGVPPIVPIIVLGGLGLFGLLIAALRRL